MNGDSVIEPELKLDKNQKGNATVFEKNLTKTTAGVTRQVVTRDFLKKYLSFIKSQKNPDMDDSCIEYAS